MFKRASSCWARSTVAIAILFWMAAADAQNPPAAAPPPAAQGQPQPAATDYDALLAKAAKLYYSSANDGLAGFTCALHPDWHALFVSARPNEAVSPADDRIVLLNSVKITLHARMKGGSTMDWEQNPDPAKPLDQDSTTLLKDMHAATEQTLQGFLQFWTPFIDGSAIPQSSAGLDVTQTASGYILHSKSSDTEVTETIGNSLLLEHFDVIMSNATVKFAPSYQSSAKGLLVTGFQAQILQPGNPPEKAQEMRVGIEYKTVQGFPIPSQLNMQVIGTGIFNFAFDSCTVSK